MPYMREPARSRHSLIGEFNRKHHSLALNRSNYTNTAKEKPESAKTGTYERLQQHISKPSLVRLAVQSILLNAIASPTLPHIARCKNFPSSQPTMLALVHSPSI